MAICKTCGKSFHACSSCGLIGHEWYYCTEDCWEISGERKELYNFISSFSKEQLEFLKNDADCDEFWSLVEIRLEELNPKEKEVEQTKKR